MRERHRHKLRGDAVNEDGGAGDGLDEELREKPGADEEHGKARPAIRRGQSPTNQNPRETEEGRIDAAQSAVILH